VELALYMGMKTYQMRQKIENPAKYDWAVCSQEGCQHGFTLGAMNAGEPRTSYVEDQHPWYDCKSLLLEPPTLGFQNGVLTITCPEVFDPQDDEDYEFDSIEDAMDVTGRLLTNRRLYSVYKERIEMHWLVFEHKGLKRKIASVIIEPILSGQSFVDPLWQRALVDVAKSRNVPIIFDEVRSGLYRVGVPSCREILQVDPDITCYGNHLSGGMVPLSAAAATQEVFDAFDEDEGLLCGDAFAGHPTGCASAIHTLDAYASSIVTNGQRKPKPSLHMLFSEDGVNALSQLPLVEECFSLGTVLVVTIQEGENDDDKYHQTLSVLERLEKTGVLAKSVGNVIQITLPPLTHRDVCTKVLDAVRNAIEMSDNETCMGRNET
jgi:dethiobiotin synthetase/adenosylmethionine--8-amino-7-oxononanoate aminotransferase